MTDNSSIKMILIGDSGTGKSSLLLSYTEHRFLPEDEAVATVGVDFRLLKMEFRGRQYKVYIWDTAGQERFRTLTSSFYRGAAVVFVVYDVSNRESFDNLETWLNEVSLYCADRKLLVCLVANKADIDESKRRVSRQEGIAFAASKDAEYREVSAKTMLGVNDLFDSFAEQVASSPDLFNANASGSIQISSQNLGSQSSCAC